MVRRISGLLLSIPLVLVIGCGSSDTPLGSGSGATAGDGGSGGTAGTAGASGSAGTAGIAGNGGSSGSAGNGGSSGASGTAGSGGTGATGGTAGSSGSGGTGATGGSAGVGGTAGSGGTTPQTCVPGAIENCYDGASATLDVGVCKGGQRTCLPDGSAFGPCDGQVLPAPAEDCTTPVDDDCNGQINEDSAGCVCTPGETASCYEGPDGTLNVGACKTGLKTCASDGKSYGACEGQVTPVPETCSSPPDDDCDGLTNEEGPDCACVPGAVVACYSGPPGTSGVGICKSGTQTCANDGLGYGACQGEITPQAETCNTTTDDDCDGQINEEGAGCVCLPNAVSSCYSGPPGTAGVGICKSGTATCNAQGTALGQCGGEITPQTESCNNVTDDDCDGLINESGPGCVCIPNSVSSCYTGPSGTQGVGICQAGTKTCNAQGTAFGSCSNQVLPAASENCATASDDNCNGQTNEGCIVAVTYAADVKPIFQAKCATCHTTGGSGGTNFASSYADSQAPSAFCPGKTVGACALSRIKDGSMPPGAGCTGNPVTDAGNLACLTQAQQNTIQAWITGGQLPLSVRVDAVMSTSSWSG